MIHYRLTLFAVLIFVLTLLPASSYANEAGVGDSTGTGQVNKMMSMPGHDMSGHTMEMPASNTTVQDPGSAGPEQTTGNMSNHNMDMSAPSGGDMAGHNMSGTSSDTISSQNMDISGQNPANDTTSHDTSAGDMANQNMNGMDHNMTAEQPEHNMMNMPDDHQAMGHGGSTSDLSPSAKEVNRASLLGGFGLVNGFIVLAAVILKRKTKVGGAV